jgi:hypothetical protein
LWTQLKTEFLLSSFILLITFPMIQIKLLNGELLSLPVEDFTLAGSLADSVNALMEKEDNVIHSKVELFAEGEKISPEQPMKDVQCEMLDAIRVSYTADSLLERIFDTYTQQGDFAIVPFANNGCSILVLKKIGGKVRYQLWQYDYGFDFRRQFNDLVKDGLYKGKTLEVVVSGSLLEIFLNKIVAEYSYPFNKYTFNGSPF